MEDMDTSHLTRHQALWLRLSKPFVREGVEAARKTAAEIDWLAATDNFKPETLYYLFSRISVDVTGYGELDNDELESLSFWIDRGEEPPSLTEYRDELEVYIDSAECADDERDYYTLCLQMYWDGAMYLLRYVVLDILAEVWRSARKDGPLSDHLPWTLDPDARPWEKSIEMYLDYMVGYAAPILAGHHPIHFGDWFLAHIAEVFPTHRTEKLHSCILKVKEEAKKENLWIKKQSEWISIFRACADRGLYEATDYKSFYEDISDKVRTLSPPLAYDSLKRAGADFSHEWRKWKPGCTKISALNRMLFCAKKMDEILEAYGF